MDSVRELKVSMEWLRLYAELGGLDLDDERLKALMPQIERSLQIAYGLDRFELGPIEPANHFSLRED